MVYLTLFLRNCFLYKNLHSAARLISLTAKYDHITPVLIDLHCTPVRQRTEYKFLLLVYKCLHGLAPSYLAELLNQRPDRGSRRDGEHLLLVPKVKRATFGGISFSRSGPELWNSLPCNIRAFTNLEDFKLNVKTYLFKSAFKLP